MFLIKLIMMWLILAFYVVNFKFPGRSLLRQLRMKIPSFPREFLLAKSMSLVNCLVTAVCRCLRAPIPDDLTARDRILFGIIVSSHTVGIVVIRAIAAIGLFGTVESLNRKVFDMMAVLPKPVIQNVSSREMMFDDVHVTVHQKCPQTSAEPNGAQDIPLRPAIFFIKGGGWVYSPKELSAIMERHLASELNVVVVSVHYRLAPEYPYPAGLTDCLNALLYFRVHCRDFNVDCEQITIAGDSCGGNLAAAICLKLRDSGRDFLQRQILISPVLQLTSFRTTSYLDLAKFSSFIDRRAFPMYLNQKGDVFDHMITNSHLSDHIYQHKAWPYLTKYHKPDHVDSPRNEDIADFFAEKLTDPYLAPLMADSLSDLPPALLLASEYDMFRDDALAYGERLAADGTEVKVLRSNGFHGAYYLFMQSDVGDEMVRSIVEYLKDVYQESSEKIVT